MSNPNKIGQSTEYDDRGYELPEPGSNAAAAADDIAFEEHLKELSEKITAKNSAEIEAASSETIRNSNSSDTGEAVEEDPDTLPMYDDRGYKLPKPGSNAAAAADDIAFEEHLKELSEKKGA
ncbi:hypothetical protein IKE97_00195 [Candidatus Saccharibacteria bacterium]|nr:hypothetical protein [Candidatus Saccharibacteria bacterium]